MHGRSLAWVRDRCQVEGLSRRVVLFAIAAYGDRRDGSCTASAATLARTAGLSVRQVRRVLDDLIFLELVELVERGRGRRPSVHRVHPSLWTRSDDTAMSSLDEGVVVTSQTRSGDIRGSVVVTSTSLEIAT